MLRKYLLFSLLIIFKHGRLSQRKSVAVKISLTNKFPSLNQDSLLMTITGDLNVR